MKRTQFKVDDFVTHPITLWKDQGLLLTAGDFKAGKFNTMTVGWGSIGVMWGKSFIHVVVRPVRHTFKFIEEYDTFTVCGFPKEYKKELILLGSKSGRDGDKIKESGLTPIQSKAVAAPGFEEAELIMECRKIYSDDFRPERFIDPSINKNYSKKDYHRFYYGEILRIEGDSSDM